MPLEDDAREVHDFVRDHFKVGHKSANKRYFKTGLAREYLPWKPGDAVLPKEEKKRQRNHHAEVGGPHLDRLQAGDHRPYLRGQAVADAKSNPLRVGNCYEMACMAGWIIATQKLNYSAWICGINDPGDHALCIMMPREAGRRTPCWDTVRSFDADLGDSYVIDPWAGVCCALHDYRLTFIDKMREWTSKGKRIAFSRQRPCASGWFAPASPSYLNGFQNGPLSYTPVEAPQALAHPEPLMALQPAALDFPCMPRIMRARLQARESKNKAEPDAENQWLRCPTPPTSLLEVGNDPLLFNLFSQMPPFQLDSLPSGAASNSGGETQSASGASQAPWPSWQDFLASPRAESPPSPGSPVESRKRKR